MAIPIPLFLRDRCQHRWSLASEWKPKAFLAARGAKCFYRLLFFQILFPAAFFLCQCTGLAGAKGELVFESLPQARYYFDGVIGQRIQANVDRWLLEMPAANPGMLEMFRRRDREPSPDLVPWAGEFAGKYLISAIQALRLADRADLRDLTGRVVKALLASQDEDGYLGPFPKAARWRGDGDWWGHYHVLLALLLWHEATGEAEALRAARRAADLICTVILDSGPASHDPSSPEMRQAVVHALGWLHRLTLQPRYWQAMCQIEKDWEKGGDYLRTGLQGVDFFQTPRPRWESLHNLQGLVELYRIGGEEPYQAAFLHHWRSLRRWDRRNTGGFSSEERASGNAFAPTAIETCATVAWMAVSVDMLRLTGEAAAADELELATYNAACGAQHPSGSWWTYDTPMDGVRKSSAQSLVFQARAGAPDLNCCAVNGSRSLGLLSEWAVMQTKDGLAVNYYGPGTFQGKLADNSPVALQIDTGYPLSGNVQIRVEPLVPKSFQLRLRIPSWSNGTVLRVNQQRLDPPVSGQYYNLSRRWRAGDRIQVEFDLSIRAVPGDRETRGRVSLYRGPVLLAFDEHHNSFDEGELPELELRRLTDARVAYLRPPGEADPLQPWILLDAPAQGEKRVRLVDFASAGARGTRYRTWLRALDF